MKHILHILKKDMTRFRIEILLVFLSAVISVRNETPQAGVQKPAVFSALFWIAGTLLTSMVVHAEAIPGNKLYWLTRPYRWKSLLAEKLLFLFLFVGLPPVLVMFVSLVGAGFSLGEFFPSLVLREVTILVVWILPVAALAAVTEGLASFLVGLLFVGALSTALSGLLCCSPNQQLYPHALVWVPATLASLILTCGAVAVLFIQYKQRRTILGRACIAVTVILGVVMLISTPLALGMQVQSLFSRDIDHSSMGVSLSNEVFSDDHGRGFLLDLEGTPPGLNAHADVLVGEVIDKDGQATDFSMRDIVLTSHTPAGTTRIHAFMSDSDIARLRGKPVTVRGSVYVTLFTAPRSWQQSASETKTVVDGVRCGPAPYRPDVFTCRAKLGSPRGTLSIVRTGENHILSMASGSHWPFQNLALSPYEELLFVWQSQARIVEFHYREAVSHFGLNFEIPVERFLE
jgi:hypothetical protein